MSIQVEKREWLVPKKVAHELRLHVASIYRAVEGSERPAL